MAFAGGVLEPGVTLIIEAVKLEERLRGADLCLTAEGAIDGSSAFGKTAVGVARLARSVGVPTLALAGSIGPGAEDVLLEGVDAYFSICPGPVPLDHAIDHAARLLEDAAEHAMRAFLAGRRGPVSTGGVEVMNDVLGLMTAFGMMTTSAYIGGALICLGHRRLSRWLLVASIGFAVDFLVSAVQQCNAMTWQLANPASFFQSDLNYLGMNLLAARLAKIAVVVGLAAAFLDIRRKLAAAKGPVDDLA